MSEEFEEDRAEYPVDQTAVDRAAAASAYGVAYGDDETDEEPDDESRQPLRLIGLLLLIATAILLLLLTTCDGGKGTVTGVSDKGIVGVAGSHPVTGTVSVWIESGKSIDIVLTDAGVTATRKVNMGQGRWVIGVAEGSEGRSANALRDTSGVHDAGLVYPDPEPLEGETGTYTGSE